MNFNRLLSLQTVILLCLMLTDAAYGQPEMAEGELSWDRRISRLFGKYCYQCHNDAKMQGEVDLKSDFDLKRILDHRDVWLRVGDQLEFEAMPPGGAKQPSQDEAALMLEFVDKRVRQINCDGQIDPGKPMTRRLNKAEYVNSIVALTGLSAELTDSISADPIAYGFDNIATSLTLTSVQMEQYDQAADRILQAMFNIEATSNLTLDKLFATDGKKDFRSAGNAIADKFAGAIVERFATSAYRRPVGLHDQNRLEQLYKRLRLNQYDSSASMSIVMRAILLSPRFLFRIETVQPDAPEPYLVDSYDLISRLSFFLWSAPPDRELLQYAEEHDLQTPQQVQELARKMIADERLADGVIGRFFMQWLRLDDLENHAIDATIVDDLPSGLLANMKAEVAQTLIHAIRNNGRIDDLLRSDSLLVNRELAAWYGIEDSFDQTMQSLQQTEPTIKASDFIRVAATSTHRGGVLTSGAVLVSTADPNRTNVPRRGNYVAGVFLGDPPPPPPPGVPELVASSADTASLSLRQRLELHRSDAACASCHAKMDPIGFALENFDLAGRWREQDAGQPIDGSGELTSGEKFNGPDELKLALLQQREKITRHLAKQMLIFALGRGLDYRDDCTIEVIVVACREQDWKLAALVESVLTCDAFRYRKNAEF